MYMQLVTLYGGQSSEGTLGCFHLQFVLVGVACGSNMFECRIVHMGLIMRFL